MPASKPRRTDDVDLTYPFEKRPEPGEMKEVAPGVFWVRMTLPFVLNHINLWLLKDGDGWTLVDTGLKGDETRRLWQQIFDEKLNGAPLTRIIGTHLHPDHIGLAGWLARKFDVELFMSRTEYLLCRTLIPDSVREAPEIAVRFYRAAGFPERALDAFKQRFGGFGDLVSHMPDSFRRLVDGQVVPIGDHDWEVVVGQGHSPEHVCLYCAKLKVLISGDQVLPRITSNISVHPTEQYANPLGEWLQSCKDLQARLPDDLLVLPSHNEPFYGLHNRLKDLVIGHEENLEALCALLEEPKRAVDVFPALFKRKIDEGTFFMATGEALAHLNYLIECGQAKRERDGQGVDWYSQI